MTQGHLNDDEAREYWGESKPHKRPSADRLQALRDYYIHDLPEIRDGEGDVADLFAEIDSLEEQLEVLRGSLEAMLPGTLASEVEYQTNAAYHACVYIAKKTLETTSNPASEPEERP